MHRHQETNPHFRQPQPPKPGVHPNQPHEQRPESFPSARQPSERRPGPTTPAQQSQPPTTPFSSQLQPNLRVPSPKETKALTWFTAVFCAIFWVIVIVGGLVVLVVYLLFRPRSPRFDISSVTLNAAYLDMGYLLNADVTILANFTNPNKKVRVDFRYLVLNLYYGETLIASRAIDPFSASSMQTMFADVHMVTSQVSLPMKESLELAREIQSNSIKFQLKGYFKTRSNLGSFLRYTYWLYGKCSIVVTAPPSGVLVKRSCRTKR